MSLGLAAGGEAVGAAAQGGQGRQAHWQERQCLELGLRCSSTSFKDDDCMLSVDCTMPFSNFMQLEGHCTCRCVQGADVSSEGPAAVLSLAICSL